MALYAVYVFCNECADTHGMEIGVDLNDGPPKRESIGDTYAGKELPKKIVELMSNYTLCPKTKRFFLQKDNHQVFLVPVGDSLSPPRKPPAS